MNSILMIMLLVLFLIIEKPFLYFDSVSYGQDHHMHHSEEEHERGPMGGKLFRDDNFSLEITIFEKGVPPHFRVYSYDVNTLVDPSKVQLSIELHRLDGEVNSYTFTPEKNMLVGNGVVAEPHSFDVKMSAIYEGKTYKWEFKSYEGRTEISEEAAQKAGVRTETATTATIRKYIRLTGRIIPNRNTTAKIRARFPGIVKSVNVLWGQRVRKGDLLAKVESNQSLSIYNVVSPVSGVILERNTNVGDVAGDKPLFTVADLSEVWAEFHVFPSDLPDIKHGQIVNVYNIGNYKDEVPENTKAFVKMLLPTADENSQTVLAIIPLKNKEGLWRPGMTVKGDVLVEEKQVPLAVKTSALQSFRDFNVVFAKVDNTYEARMLELGMNDGEMVEVLSGLKPGTEYVTENSFLIKADIEKSGATHDH